MNCDELVERVTDYLDGALDRTDRTRMDDHLLVCIGCQAHLSEVDVTLGLVGSLEPEPLPAALASSLLAIHRTWTQSLR